jgi:hypothetical protein
MDCLVIYMNRGSKCSALVHGVSKDNWFERFRSQHTYDNIISHMFIG